MMHFYNANGDKITVENVLAQGGEATVYRVKDQPELVAKIYKTDRPDYDQKLAWMIAHPPVHSQQTRQHTALVWPTERLYRANKTLAGYVMPYLENSVALLEVFNPRLRRQTLPDFTGRYLYRAAHNLAATLHTLHARGYVVGDLNESNIRVTPAALVTLIDVDSFQVQGDGTCFLCPVGKIEYTPPELQGQDLRTTVQTPAHDNFALAVLLFQMLVEGSHPFRSRWLGDGDAPALAEKLRRGLYPYANPAPTLVAPPPGRSLDHLPPAIVALFQRCFVDGHAHPEQRPTAQEWTNALTLAEQSLITCAQGHAYAGHLTTCPECRLALVRAQRPEPRVRPATPTRPAPPTSAPVSQPAPAAPKLLPITNLTKEQKKALAYDEELTRVSRFLFLIVSSIFLIFISLILIKWFYDKIWLIWLVIFFLFNFVKPEKLLPIARLLWVTFYQPARRFHREHLTTQGTVIDRQKGIRDGDYLIAYLFTAQLSNGSTKDIIRTEQVKEEIYYHLQIGRSLVVQYAPYDTALVRIEPPATRGHSTPALLLWLRKHAPVLLGTSRGTAALAVRPPAAGTVTTQGIVLARTHDRQNKTYLVTYAFTTRMIDGTQQRWQRTERVAPEVYMQLRRGGAVPVRYATANMGKAAIDLCMPDQLRQQGETLINLGGTLLLIVLLLLTILLIL